MTKYFSLFKQESLYQILSLKGIHEDLCDCLTEEEIDRLVEMNSVFIRTFSPSSKVDLEGISINGSMVLINIEGNLLGKLLPEEITAILLHEIGHALNPDHTGLDGEYIADNFAAEKGYADWIVRSLEKGLRNNWLGFDQEEIESRKQNLLGGN